MEVLVNKFLLKRDQNKAYEIIKQNNYKVLLKSL